MSLKSLEKILPGQIVMVETKFDLIAGTVFKINGNTILELVDAKDVNMNHRFSTKQFLQVNDIKTITIINCKSGFNEDNESTSSFRTAFSSVSADDIAELDVKFVPNCIIKDKVTTSATTDNALKFKCHTNEETECTKKFLTSTDDYSSELDQIFIRKLDTIEQEHIENMVQSLVLICQTDHQYHKALADIKQQHHISLIVDPCFYVRIHKTSYIAIGTPNVIYIFDMISLGKVYKELKVVLEAERPKKIVHYSNRICDHLKKRQDVHLNGVFDTFVVFSILTKERQSKLQKSEAIDTNKFNPANEIKLSKAYNFFEVVEQVFGITKLYFENITENTAPSNLIYSRPSSRKYQIIMAKQAVLQLKLYEFLNDQLLKNVYNQCKKFSCTLSNINIAKLYSNITENKNSTKF